MDRSAASLCFDSAAIDPRNRESAVRELFGRGFMNLDFDFHAENCDLEAALWELPGVAIIAGNYSAATLRVHDQSRENDDVSLTWAFAERRATMRSRGRDVSSGDGGAVLIECGERMRADSGSLTSARTVRLRRDLMPISRTQLDSALMRQIPGDHPAMVLLNAYLPLVCNEAVLHSPELAQAAADHICDLVALAITPMDSDAAPRDRAVLAGVRLPVIQRWVYRHSSDPALSIATAARVHHLSTRTIQALFHDSGTTFTDYLLKCRLERVSRQLGRGGFAAQPIARMAYAAGFSDLSYFNRAFRARYGCTPSDTRAGGLH